MNSSKQDYGKSGSLANRRTTCLMAHIHFFMSLKKDSTERSTRRHIRDSVSTSTFMIRDVRKPIHREAENIAKRKIGPQSS